jgi:tetratricopeptide (TPR) repeat protein
LGKLEQALADYSSAIALDPRYALGWSNRAAVRLKRQEHDQAIADASEAIRLNSKLATAYNIRGKARTSRREFPEALDDLSRAIALNPQYAQAFHNRGIVRSKLQAYSQAVEDFSECLRLDAQFPGALTERGLVREKLGDFANAIDDYQAALKSNPKNLMACNNLAWLWATCPDELFRDGPKAVEYATTACELTNWKDAEKIDTLAAAHAERGEFDKAVELQERALNLVEPALQQEFQSRLDLYRDGQPYRTKPPDGARS